MYSFTKEDLRRQLQAIQKAIPSAAYDLPDVIVRAKLHGAHQTHKEATEALKKIEPYLLKERELKEQIRRCTQ